MKRLWLPKLILVALFLFCLESIGADDDADDQTAVAALKRLGVHTGLDAQQRVVLVNFARMKDRAQLTDAALGRLNWKGLPHVQIVNLSFTPITDAGLAHLKAVRGLKELDLYYTNVTDAGIATLPEFPGLESLHYGSKHVTAASIRHLRDIEKLYRHHKWYGHFSTRLVQFRRRTGYAHGDQQVHTSGPLVKDSPNLPDSLKHSGVSKEAEEELV